MHIDGRQLEDSATVEGDICIVGAGAAGISIALDWMNISKKKVILLEGGGFEYDERCQELYRGKTTGQPYYPLKSTRLHYFGGTTGHWAGMCSFFDPIAFSKRDWVENSGWPFGQQELMPYYKKAYRSLNIDTFEFDIGYWRGVEPDLTMLPLSDEVFWHKVWQFGDPTARFGTKYRDTIVGAQNIHLYTYANVVDIKTNDSVSSVKELTAKNYAGKTFKVVAKQFVIACCSIQGTRLLLSSNSQAKQGLGNDHDLVGRYFMEHAEIQTAELWLKQKADLTLYSGTPKQMRAELALKPEAQQKMGVLNGIMSLSPLESAREIPAFIKTWTDDDPRKNEERVGEIYRKSSRGRIARKLLSNEYEAFRVTLRTEQAPNPLSRVTLDTERDELGMPRAILNWAFTDLDRRSMRQIYRALGEQIGAAGIGRVKLTEELADPGNTAMPASTSGGWHHMGTTRMNEDPKKGVVDANCKVHGIDNLYIAGSSCFPTGGGVNPTFTLVALSLRLSQFLKDKTLAA